MEDYLYKTIPNLKPFNYELHHDNHFINKRWVLVNGISKKKSVYTFKKDNILEISRHNQVIETSWTLDIKNNFCIETEDGLINVKAYFKDNDILVLNQEDKNEFAIYINTTNYENELNSVDDIKNYLKDKYRRKASNVIHKHKFYYIEKSNEFGPYKVEELTKKVKNEEISAYCFVRDVNEDDYSKRLRINDLITELD